MDINITPTPTGFSVILSAEGYADKPYSFTKYSQVENMLDNLPNIVNADFEGALDFNV